MRCKPVDSKHEEVQSEESEEHISDGGTPTNRHLIAGEAGKASIAMENCEQALLNEVTFADTILNNQSP